MIAHRFPRSFRHPPALPVSVAPAVLGVLFLLLLTGDLARAARPLTRFDFETAESGCELSLGAAPSDEPAAVIAGKRSLLVDTRKRGIEWCEFFHTQSDKVPLKPGATYTVRFKYRILDLGAGDCYLYALARSRSGGQQSVQGWTPIKAEQADSGEEQISVTIDDKTDYQVLIGFHNGWCIVSHRELQVFVIGITA